ncbi:hypothetical protein vseg_010968 [Gypsophila vaccaria]
MSRVITQLLCTSPSSLAKLMPLFPVGSTPPAYYLTKKYSKYHQGEDDSKEEKILNKERAPSTAEIMDELTHEKEDTERRLHEKSEQGFVSQTSDKALDATKEAISGTGDPNAVKQKYKEGSPGQTYHKPRDDGGVGPTSV